MDIDRDKASSLGVTAQTRSRTRCTPPTAQRQISTIYAPNNAVPGDPGSGAAVPARSRELLSLLYVRVAERPTGAAQHGGQADAHAGAALGQPSGAAARRHDFVQPAPGVSLGDAVNEVNSLAREIAAADHVTTSFQGTAQAFQSSLSGSGHAAGDGDPRHLHRAGHSVRELHPSDHDSVGTAVGGFGALLTLDGSFRADGTLGT